MNKNNYRSQFAYTIAAVAVLAGCSDSGQQASEQVGENEGQALSSGPSKAEQKAVLRALEAPAAALPLLHPGLAQRLASASATQGLQVDVFLADHADSDDMPAESGTGDLSASGSGHVQLNGRAVGPKDIEQQLAVMAARTQARQAAKQQKNAARWRAVAARWGLSDAQVQLPIRAGASSAALTLPAGVVRKIAEEAGAGLVQGIAPRFNAAGADGLTSALASVEVSTVAFPAGWNGSSVGLWLNDGDGKPDTTKACVNSNRLTIQDFGSEPVETHATQTLCTLQASATDARVHYAVPTQSCNLRSDVASFANPPVYASSNSNSFGDDDTSYSDCSRDWDNFVYNTNIAHFALTQNQTSNVRGASKAYNVISVGAYDDPASPDAIASFSNFGDPATGADKPEIVGPGVNIDVGTWTGLNGTSFATPIAAGFGADVLEYRQPSATSRRCSRPI